jgi:predicted ATPase
MRGGWKKGSTPENTIEVEGVENFPENRSILSNPRPKAKEYLDLRETSIKWQYYHGFERAECLMVKYRREKTYQNHYIDIWYCLTHKKECCRCGVEFEYYQLGLYEHDHDF